jgi:group I intron endonuclease
LIIDPVIYVIINIINDKQYVGQAFRKHFRWKNHKIALKTNAHSNKHLQASYNKYGKDAFVFLVLENLFDCSNLDEREDYWIKLLKPEYNKAPVAGSCLGFKHSEETKALWSKQRKGKKRSEEFKLVISKSWETRIVSDEAKANMSKAHIGKTQSEETKAKRSLAMRGNTRNNGKKRSKPMSEETRKKIGAANRAAHRKRNKPLDNI